MPGTVLGTGAAALNEIDHNSCSHGVYFHKENNQVSKLYFLLDFLSSMEKNAAGKVNRELGCGLVVAGGTCTQ